MMVRASWSCLGLGRADLLSELNSTLVEPIGEFGSSRTSYHDCIPGYVISFIAYVIECGNETTVVSLSIKSMNSSTKGGGGGPILQIMISERGIISNAKCMAHAAHLRSAHAHLVSRCNQRGRPAAA